MPGLVVAVILGASLLLVHFTLRSQPMPPKRPLNVDDNLPLPWLAQTSAVFSLTALFGGYFGVAVALGLPALMGLACGTVLGLFILRRWINSKLGDTPEERSFEYFLSRILKGDKANRAAYGFFISGFQCLYAASELLILRELARVALGLNSEQATLLAVGLAIMGYFYVLHGGYMAVFRTDVVQLLLVVVMAITASIFLIVSNAQVGWTSRLWPRPGFWELPFLGSGGLLYVYHFIIATITGLGLLLASPDTWKRVFQVNRTKRKPAVQALIFVGVGVLPYLVLFPIAITLSLNVDRSVRRSFTLPPALSDNRIFVAAALGLISSFLSSFNSAMLASVHIGIMLRRSLMKAEETGKETNKEASKEADSEEVPFYRLMMVALVVICFLFGAGVMFFSYPQWIGFTNPWVLGNMLIGAAAAVVGVQIGTAGDISRLPRFTLQWILALGTVGWLVYFLNSPGFSPMPTIECMHTVPPAVLVCVLSAISSRLLIIGGRIYAGPARNN